MDGGRRVRQSVDRRDERGRSFSDQPGPSARSGPPAAPRRCRARRLCPRPAARPRRLEIVERLDRRRNARPGRTRPGRARTRRSPARARPRRPVRRRRWRRQRSRRPRRRTASSIEPIGSPGSPPARRMSSARPGVAVPSSRWIEVGERRGRRGQRGQVGPSCPRRRRSGGRAGPARRQGAQGGDRGGRGGRGGVVDEGDPSPRRRSPCGSAPRKVVSPAPIGLRRRAAQPGGGRAARAFSAP